MLIAFYSICYTVSLIKVNIVRYRLPKKKRSEDTYTYQSVESRLTLTIVVEMVHKLRSMNDREVQERRVRVIIANTGNLFPEHGTVSRFSPCAHVGL